MNFKDEKVKKIGVALGIAALIVIGIITVMSLTAPYAVTADGEKVKNPYNLCIDGEAVAMFASEEDCNKVIEEIKTHYIDEKSEIESIEVKEELTCEKVKLKRGAKHPKIDDIDETVDLVLSGTEEKTTYTVKEGDTDWDIAQKLGISIKKLCEWNDTDSLEIIHEGDVLNTYEEKPLVHITTVETKTYTKKVKYKTKYIKTDKYTIGTYKTKKEGKYGKKKVTSKITRVNGKVKKEKIIKSKTIKEPVTAVVYKGTKPAGSSVVDYAMQFLGNPYVYGGSSLTGGTDCSGFTMSVYAHFGYSLPHNSWAQLGSGRAVSYSEAQPGDLIIYGNHVAIYAGGGMIIHASSPSTGITTGSATYRTIVGVRRIIN